MFKKRFVLAVFLVISVFSFSDIACGAITWEKTFGGADNDTSFSARQTSDGGYVVTGTTDSFGAGGGDVYLVKVDSLGNLLWEMTFGGTGSDAGRAVLETSDGGIVIAGYRDWAWYSTGDLYLIKTDSTGTLIWEKTIGGSLDERGYSIQETSDSGFIITGYTHSYGAVGTDVYLVKTDSSGNPVWEKTFGGTSDDYGNAVLETSDGGFLIAGGYYNVYCSTNGEAYLIKTDSSGTLEWEKKFGTAGQDVAMSVVESSDGNYIVTGWYGECSGTPDAFLAKIDTSGNLVWEKTFGGTEHDSGISLQKTTDDGFIIAGDTGSFGSGGTDVYLIKTDSSGNALWEKTFGGAGYEGSTSIQQTFDGGFILSGNTTSFGAGNYDMYVIKTDISGDVIPGDIDGDDVPDSDDICPYEDATGFDADNDGCIDSLSGLTGNIETLLNEGVIDEQLETSVVTKVQNAEKSANKDNICAAINQLEALKNQVNAQRGNKISNEAADLLIAYTNNVIASLLNQLPPGENC